jgi:hypothetical protein
LAQSERFFCYKPLSPAFGFGIFPHLPAAKGFVILCTLCLFVFVLENENWCATLTSRRLCFLLGMDFFGYPTCRPDEITLAFNGGKDSVVLLHLIHVMLEHQHHIRGHGAEPLPRLRTIYFLLPNSFSEVTEFMHFAAKQFVDAKPVTHTRMHYPA